MAEKSASSVYIGAPEEFAEWAGYTVDELLNGAAEAGMDNTDEPEDEEESTDSNEESGGFLSRLLG
jgi:hypothetical protein